MDTFLNILALVMFFGPFVAVFTAGAIDQMRK